MKKGEEITLTVEKFADRGKSLARVDGYVVFVAGAVPGDQILARITRRKKSYAEARMLRLIRPGPQRTQPRCEYAGVCGGCKWQHVDYEAQLEAKRASVEEAFIHHGGFGEVEVRPTLGAEHTFHYRNKMEYSFSAARWLTPDEIASGEKFDISFALGLHAPGRFDRVIDLKACYLPHPISMRLVNAFRTFTRDRGWSAWDIRAHTGYLRHMVVRTGTRTGDVMVNLVTNGFDPERCEAASVFFQDAFSEVTTFVNTIHTGPARVAIGETYHVAFGPGVIHDRIGPFTFEIAPQAFFQTNTAQAERLYEIARRFADLRPDDVVYDLYCGAGTISIFMAPHAGRVVGVELVPEAVENARANARANGIGNCTFIAGDLKTLFTPEFVRTHGRPDVLVVDPPRAGMHARVVAEIAALKPRRLVYVSCNPQTQVRDLKELAGLYTVEAIQPVDLFPHTYHIENVAALRLQAGV